MEKTLAETSIDDAVLLGSLGWSLAAQERDWKAAIFRTSRCIDHPAWAKADRPSHHTLLGNVAVAQLQLGEVDAAVQGFRELMAHQKPRDPVPLCIVRNSLYFYCLEQSLEQIAPTDLVGLSSDTLLGFKSCAKVSRGLSSDSCSFGELAAALELSFPVESGWRGHVQSLTPK